jgi:redox-sensitive bicupin YhaK (pirin superfamily)
MNGILRVFKLGFPWETQDPFLFCAHHADAYPEGNDEFGPNSSLAGRKLGEDFVIKEGWRMYHGQTVPGFPYHPHRGFETITIAAEGLIDHADSLGAYGRFGDGDVQWMTAGKGVQHSEMFPLIHKDQENPLEIFQIWLNLPQKDKMVEPHYAMIWNHDVPHVKEKDEQGNSIELKLISGNYKKVVGPKCAPNSWANNPEHEVRVWTIKMSPNAEWILPKAFGDVNRTLFFYSGSEMEISNQNISSYTGVTLEGDKDIQIKNGETDACILFLQGSPINEPVAQYGPFVMNSEEEIRQAFSDYQTTQFGGWPWDKPDPVHGSLKKRFAIYADGTKEEW